MHLLSKKGCIRLLIFVAVREKGLQPGFRHPSTRFSLVNRNPDYCDFISASHRRVPETTFNNMHGTLANVGTSDATAWRSKPNMGALEKVGNLKYNWRNIGQGFVFGKVNSKVSLVPTYLAVSLLQQIFKITK